MKKNKFKPELKIGLMATALAALGLLVCIGINDPKVWIWNTLLILNYCVIFGLAIRQLTKVPETLLEFKQEPPRDEDRYKTLEVFIRQCRPADWKEIFEYFCLSAKLHRTPDKGVLSEGILWAEAVSLVTSIEAENKITWDPAEVEHAAQLLSERMKESCDEIETEIIQNSFKTISKNHGMKIGYQPFINIFLKYENIRKVFESKK